MHHRLLNLAAPLALLIVFGLAAVMLVPAALGLQRYVITTGSMAGSYGPGSLVFDERVPVADLRVGDVITFRPPADADVPGRITHRIVNISPDAEGRLSFRTKGDANRSRDPFTFVPEGDRMNRVAAGVPHLGYVYSFLNSRNGRVLVFMIPGLLIAFGAVSSLWREAGEATRRGQRTELPA